MFATYPICHWSGSVGPKMRDGDKQAPEGFYAVNRGQTRHVGRWPKSLNIGFPNILDQSQARTGSNILIHGGCSSVGCFAMTNPVMDEIHNLTASAIDGGQDYVPIHVYPFRMTGENMKANATSPWFNFWANLKQGYDAFEQSHKPFAVNVCDGRYNFEPVQNARDTGMISACSPTISGIQDQDQWLREVPAPGPRQESRRDFRPEATPNSRPDARKVEDSGFPKLRWPLPLADAADAPPG